MGFVALFYIGLVFFVLALVGLDAFGLSKDGGQVNVARAGSIAQTAFNAGL